MKEPNDIMKMIRKLEKDREEAIDWADKQFMDGKIMALTWVLT